MAGQWKCDPTTNLVTARSIFTLDLCLHLLQELGASQVTMYARIWVKVALQRFAVES